jgi:hypothetical protein
MNERQGIFIIMPKVIEISSESDLSEDEIYL